MKGMTDAQKGIGLAIVVLLIILYFYFSSGYEIVQPVEVPQVLWEECWEICGNDINLNSIVNLHNVEEGAAYYCICESGTIHRAYLPS